jgi:hypothetical protein
VRGGRADSEIHFILALSVALNCHVSKGMLLSQGFVVVMTSPAQDHRDGVVVYTATEVATYLQSRKRDVLRPLQRNPRDPDLLPEFRGGAPKERKG